MSADTHPHLVLIPGLDGSGELFASFLAAWHARVGSGEEGCSVITLPAERPVPYAELPEYVLGQLPAQVRGGPLVLLGESYSGPLALLLAAEAGLDIRGVVMVASFARYPFSWLRLVAHLLPLSWLLRLSPPAGVLRHFCFGDLTTAALLQQLRAAIATNQPTVLAQRMRAGMRIDVRNRLPEIDVPVLYLRPQSDRLVPAAALAPLRSGLRNLQIIHLAGPHFILQTRPEACSHILSDFFVRLAAQ